MRKRERDGEREKEISEQKYREAAASVRGEKRVRGMRRRRKEI